MHLVGKITPGLIFPISFFLLGNCIISESSSSQGSHPIPYALSPVYLEYLENVETQLYQLLKEKTIQDSEHDVLKKYVLDYEGSVQNRKNFTDNGDNARANHQDAISSNPILSLQMINRFVKYFKNESFVGLAQGFFNLEKGVIPSSTEIEDAMDALLRLQHVYDLDSDQLAEGILDGIKTTARLSTRECYELGRFAQESGYFTLALQWYDTALQKLKNDTENGIVYSGTGLKSNLIMKAMKEVVDEHNQDYAEGMEDGDMYLFNELIHTTNYSSIAHLTLRKRVAEELTGQFLTESDPRYSEAIEANMMALCHGHNFISEKDKKKLKCWLDTKRHPYWAINPLKIELLHDSPPIIQLYDIFSDKWIAYLKHLSYSELERAPMPEEATPRTAAYAWFEDTEIPHAPVSQTVEFITGLNVRGTKAAEALQIAAYATGAHVEAHYDSRGPDDPNEPNPKGDRVTTFLVYLNEVERGGYTAFPLMGFYVKPVKNSAVLWYTNLKNGEVDDNTLHAACPVIRGQKWIATKWTHINENILKRPCGLKPEE